MAKILVVDDHPDNRDVLSRLVGFGGHEPVTAGDGEEAVLVAREEQPDLILMDLAMPKLDGWSATRQIKEDRSLEAIPVIVVTGHVTQQDIVNAQAVGCDDVVSKPVDYHVLMGKIRRHLQLPTAEAGL